MSQKIICFGEMLWDVLPTGQMPGGAPMNVAIHLQYQGHSPVVISRVGSDELGLELLNFLKQKEVGTDWVQVDEMHPTGTVLANVSNKQEVTYEIVQPVAWDFIQTEDALEKQVAGSDVFIYGSLAARSPISRQTLMALLPLSRLNVFDVNLRPPHYAPETWEELLHQANVVKMNQHELKVIAGGNQEAGDEKSALQKIKDRYKLDMVILTRGEEGAAVLSQEGYFEQAGFPVRVEDTIGSGDAFLAMFISRMLMGSSLPEALEHACALGALVATHKGATPVIDWAELEVMLE
jgi:fructokinase